MNVRSTPLPTAPAVFLGLFNLRGEIVPMFDTARLLGYNPVGVCDTAIVVTLSAGPAALMVSALPTMQSLGGPVGISEHRGTLGVFDIAEGLAVLLDVEPLVLPHTNVTGTTHNDVMALP